MSHSFSAIPNNTNERWWRDPALRINVFHCTGLCLCVFYLGYDQSLLTGLQALPRWNAYFGTPTGNILGLYAASIFLPSIITAFIGDWIATKYGRKIAVWIGSAIIIIGAVLNAAAQNGGQFIGGRVLLGTGGAITKVGAPALLHEIAHPRLRGIIGGCYYGFYYSGSFTSAWLTFAGLYIQSDWSWRMPCAFQVVGPLLVLLITATAPESPRFLVSHGLNQRALQILGKYHANGVESDPLVQWEYEEICNALMKEREMKKTSYFDFFRTKGNRKRLFVLCTLSVATNWAGNGIISYYLAPVLRQVGVTDATQITGINGGLAGYNLVLALAAGLNVERIGRRPLFFAGFIGMFFSYCFVMGLAAGYATTGNTQMGIAVIPFLFFFYGFYDISLTPLPYHYTTEILPYALRSKGLAIFTSVQNCANALNQFVNPIALAAITWRYYAVYLIILVLLMIFTYFFIVETKGLSLEEISLVMDYGRKEGRAKARELGTQVAQSENQDGTEDKSEGSQDREKSRALHVENV